VPREALQLTLKARAAVAGHLVCSLGARDEHDLDEAWVTEVKRRITDVDASSAHRGVRHGGSESRKPMPLLVFPV
jgi:hypothetical protein